MTVTQPKADVTEIERALNVLFEPRDVVELRVLDVSGKVHAGYFNIFDRLASEAAKLSGQAVGVYAVLNKVNRDLIARSQNRITIGPKNLTQDADITRRHWLPIDVDARRPSGISSTDQEHAAAIETTKAVKGYLLELGFPANSILTCDSGNGAHLLVRIDLPNDSAAGTIVKACLKALAGKFDSEKVTIDQAVFNAARIWKLPGTIARKGDSTTDRPHRIAKLLDVPASMTIAPVESLKMLAATAPEPEAPRKAAYQRSCQPFDLKVWLVKNGIEVKGTGPYKGGTRHILKTYPFNPDHTGTSAAIFQAEDGVLGFKCQHSSCANKTWSDLRELKEPGYRDRKNGHRDYDPDTDQPEHFNFTDYGNAERLASLYRDDIRYSPERKAWLIWTGKVWEWDMGGGRIAKLAKKTARNIYREAADEPDDNTRKELVKHARATERQVRIDALIKSAESEPGVAISLADLDANHWLLNFSNGTIDLRTGVLKPHERADLITEIVPIDYDANATSAEWDTFLRRIFNNNTDLIAYIRRALGYSITGDQSEQVFFLCYGSGFNGKSTLLNACRLVLGNYATQVPPTAFMVNKAKRGGPDEAIASLKNKRLVCSTELEDGQRLSVSLVKRMTGGEPLWCERKFERGYNFQPTHKLWLSGNHEPVITDTTNSIWFRLKKIPFTVEIPDSDRKKGYAEYLASKHSATILAWLVCGCVEWQQTGTLGEPEVVKQAVAEYRDQQDMLHDYLIEYCIFQKSATMDQKALYANYKQWAENNDINAIGKLNFRTRIQEKGVVAGYGNKHIAIWRGIRLRIDSDGDVNSVNSVNDFSESLLREVSTEKTLQKTVNKINTINPGNHGELPDCPACGRNEWTYSPDGELLCPCGKSLKGGKIC